MWKSFIYFFFFLQNEIYFLFFLHLLLFVLNQNSVPIPNCRGANLTWPKLLFWQLNDIICFEIKLPRLATNDWLNILLLVKTSYTLLCNFQRLKAHLFGDILWYRDFLSCIAKCKNTIFKSWKWDLTIVNKWLLIRLYFITVYNNVLQRTHYCQSVQLNHVIQ